jgi:hypothetical protein
MGYFYRKFEERCANNWLTHCPMREGCWNIFCIITTALLGHYLLNKPVIQDEDKSETNEWE